jgi:hypothetical protein
MFQIIPIAEANIVTLMESINRVIINPLIILLFALAAVYFLFGVAKFLLAQGNEEVRKTSKSHMVWGIVGMFIMIAVFGIMNIILTTLDEDRINIEDNGNYTIQEMVQ